RRMVAYIAAPQCGPTGQCARMSELRRQGQRSQSERNAKPRRLRQPEPRASCSVAQSLGTGNGERARRAAYAPAHRFALARDPHGSHMLHEPIPVASADDALLPDAEGEWPGRSSATRESSGRRSLPAPDFGDYTAHGPGLVLPCSAAAGREACVDLTRERLDLL